MEGNNFFSVVIAGEKPKKIISKYNSSKKGEKYILYEFDKAEEYQKKQISVYEELLKSDKLGDAEKEYFKGEVDYWKKLSPNDFYLEMTAGYEIDENGNAITDRNLDEKFSSYKTSPVHCTPLILKNGAKAYSARKKDVDWNKTHLGNTWKYEVAWDTVVDNKAPKNETEEEIKRNMTPWKFYLQSCFGSKENYIKGSDSFWGYAFVSEEKGWIELEDNIPQFQWVADFYDRFIAPLSDDTLLTIYECTRN